MRRIGAKSVVPIVIDGPEVSGKAPYRQDAALVQRSSSSNERYLSTLRRQTGRAGWRASLLRVPSVANAAIRGTTEMVGKLDAQIAPRDQSTQTTGAWAMMLWFAGWAEQMFDQVCEDYRHEFAPNTPESLADHFARGARLFRDFRRGIDFLNHSGLNGPEWVGVLTDCYKLHEQLYNHFGPHHLSDTEPFEARLDQAREFFESAARTVGKLRISVEEHIARNSNSRSHSI